MSRFCGAYTCRKRIVSYVSVLGINHFDVYGGHFTKWRPFTWIMFFISATKRDVTTIMYILKLLNWEKLLKEYCIVLYCIVLHCIALHCIALRCVALRCAALRCAALRCTALHCTALHCTALHCTALHCTALHCTALHCTALHCTALHCTALHCIVLYCTAICTKSVCTPCRGYLFENGRPFPEYYPIVQKLSDVGASLRCLYVFVVNTSFKLWICM